MAKDMGLDPKLAMRPRMTLGYNVREKAEVAHILERAKTHGGTILKPAHDIFWGGHSGFLPIQTDICGRLRLIRFPLSPRMAGSIGARAGCGHMVIEERSLAAIGNGAERAGALQILRDIAAGLGPDVMVEQLRAIQKRSDQQSTLRKCRVPAAVICGKLDPLAQPKRHEFMATRIHYATLHVIPNAGHYPTLEQPDMINAALREWLVQPMVLR